ncbi:hypothetical protein PI124_g14207 [Phytophthora idaei]|nr:hypothetical protein PI125_g20658 [Phytophthora idaei]KAG3145032.1 hypothetical protein PI126_g13897 [Phytophthora idaei]KAG3240899.1 hypothetical protein PI124_g14207 [Phytophthora idaei]
MTDDICSAEFVAASKSSNLLVWALNLVEELQVRRSKQTIIYEDNQAAIQVINEVRSSYKAKTVGLNVHKLRHFVERDEVMVEYCPREGNVADIFTKPLGLQHCDNAWMCCQCRV